LEKTIRLFFSKRSTFKSNYFSGRRWSASERGREEVRDNIFVGIKTKIDSKINIQAMVSVPQFYPTMAEFSDMKKYLETCRANGGGAVGAAIVNPPSEWRSNQNNNNHLQNFRIQAPIQQAYEKVADGCFTVCNTKTRNSVMFKNFKNTLGNYIGNNEPIFDSNIDNQYWSMLGPLALYGADQNGTLFEKDQKLWNLSKIEGNVIDCVPEKIEGLHSTFLS
jgi:hypothetical protein